MEKLRVLCYALLISGFLMILVGIAYEFVDMLIDHNCYQLEPNEFYESTVCEKYWKNK